VFVPVYSFTITQYDSEKPWLVLSTGRDSVELPEGEVFHDWALTRWPRPHYRVRLDTPPLTRWAY
jgi:hypothetical protein